jgi:pimeloyl-ACP methyl ester carboxylesterase
MQTPAGTRYARSGEAHIAYQTVGEGSLDLVLLPGAFSHVEHQWEEPSFDRFLRRLASFSRLIVLDVRGTGLSDRAPELPTLEEQIDDVLAVLDAVASERAALFGLSQGGGLATMFAATHPDRTTALVLFGAYARIMRTENYPFGRTPEEYEKLMLIADEGWGQRSVPATGRSDGRRRRVVQGVVGEARAAVRKPGSDPRFSPRTAGCRRAARASGDPGPHAGHSARGRCVPPPGTRAVLRRQHPGCQIRRATRPRQPSLRG